MSNLDGARVALLEGRMPGALAHLVTHHGGEPVSVPSVREETVPAGDEVAGLIDELAGGTLDVVIFSTGAGVRALFAEAERLGHGEELTEALRRVTLVCRGPKPVAALNERGLPTTLRVREPFTTPELLEALGSLDLAGSGVAVLHYGERNAALADTLTARGARLTELCLYEWRLPEDTEPLRRLAVDLIEGQFAAVAFTSQVQARHLFQVADAAGLVPALRDALNQRVIVASVGPTCTAALERLGVQPHVIPEHPKMGHLIAALARHVAERRTGAVLIP